MKKKLKSVPNIKFNSVEELEDYEHRGMGWDLYNKPQTKKEIKKSEEDFVKFLRESFGGPHLGPNDDVYLTDGMYLTPEGEIME